MNAETETVMLKEQLDVIFKEAKISIQSRQMGENDVEFEAHINVAAEISSKQLEELAQLGKFTVKRSGPGLKFVLKAY